MSRLPAIAAILALLAPVLTPHAVSAEILIATAAPMSGRIGWGGEQYRRAAGFAAEAVNARGGLLGQRVEIVVGDDACEDARGAALARSLVARGVVAVIGHACSGAALAAAPIYEAARVVMISGSATAVPLTEAGRPNVFRTVSRDDVQGRMAGHYLATHHRSDLIAILYQEDAYVRDLAEETARRLHELGIREALSLSLNGERIDWVRLVQRLRAEGITVTYFPGRSPDVGLLARHAAEAGYTLRIIGDSLNTEDFWLVAGEAGEGVVFTSPPEPRSSPAAAAAMARFREVGYEPESFAFQVYAAVEAWAQAVEKAGTLEPEAVMRVLHEAEFDTVLGRIGFDAKGDVTGVPGFSWYVWRGGRYVPRDERSSE
jgi:branched-chain amino acid transport system substrate-binding protein